MEKKNPFVSVQRTFSFGTRAHKFSQRKGTIILEYYVVIMVNAVAFNFSNGELLNLNTTCT